MRVLITAGTGKVGRELTKRIYGRGHDPIVMTHMMYEFFLQDGLPSRGDDFERMDEILGKLPRTFHEYVKEILGKTKSRPSDWTSRTQSSLRPSA